MLLNPRSPPILNLAEMLRPPLATFCSPLAELALYEPDPAGLLAQSMVLYHGPFHQSLLPNLKGWIQQVANLTWMCYNPGAKVAAKHLDITGRERREAWRLPSGTSRGG
jgi:hypothetical protein